MANAFDLFSVYNSNELTKAKLDLIMLNKTISIYNSRISKYTNDFKGTISKPVEDVSLIPNIGSNSINGYLKSKPIWNQMLKFIKESNIEDIADYIDVMIKNWNNIKRILNCTGLNIPTANIIFSLKMLNVYYNFKAKEDNADKINRKIVTNISDGFYDINPDFKSLDISNLIKLKKLNQDLSYSEIVCLFSAEFSSDFVDNLKNMSDNKVEEYLKLKKVGD